LKYVEKTFTVRVTLKDGSSKLLFGVQGTPALAHTKRLKFGKGVLVIEITALPRARGEPAEAKEL
jgi:hypothetical protein